MSIAIRNLLVIRDICNAIKEFRDLSPTMPVGRVQTFLLVALNEGASATELAELAEMKKSTASRYLLDLSVRTRSGQPGYGLVYREQDPQALRRNRYTLTSTGRAMLAALTKSTKREPI